MGACQAPNRARTSASSSGARSPSGADAAAYQYTRPSARGMHPNSCPAPHVWLISTSVATGAVVIARQAVDPS